MSDIEYVRYRVNFNLLDHGNFKMKKLIAVLVLMLTSTASFSATFVCTAYLDGAVVGEPMKINASKATVAETKAKSRLKKAGVKVNYVDCK